MYPARYFANRFFASRYWAKFGAWVAALGLDRTQSAAPYEILDPGDGGTLTVDRWEEHAPMTIAASTAETGTLADPEQAGQRVCLVATTVGSGGTRAVTASSAINAAGDTVMTFNAAYDMVLLESIPVNTGSYQWRIVVNDGPVALS